MIYRLLLIFLFFLFNVKIILATEETSKVSRPDSHAPIGIMCDHYHKKNEIMWSYRYMLMDMDGYQKNSSSTSYTRARTKPSAGTTAMNSVYMNVPVDMQMQMHMFGGMYAIDDSYTLMAMINYQNNEMKIKKHSTGQTKTLSSSGWGDTRFNVIRRIYESNIVKLHATLGLSVPTGSISKEDTMISGSKGTLGYGMQLGTGTYDILSSLTYLHTRKDFSFGFQSGAEIRTGENSKNYTVGDKYYTDIWIAKPITEINSSFSLGLKGETVGKVDGKHKEIQSIMSFAQDSESTGYKRINYSAGMNHVFSNGTRLALEYQRPLYNNVNQVQLDTEYSLILGLQHSF